MPSSAAEAVALANDGALAEPERITVKKVVGEKFDRITEWKLKERPVYHMREPGADDDDYFSNSPADLGVCKDEDIPF